MKKNPPGDRRDREKKITNLTNRPGNSLVPLVIDLQGRSGYHVSCKTEVSHGCVYREN